MRLSHLCVFVGAALLVIVISQFLLEVYLNNEEPWLFPSVYNTPEDIIRLYEEVTEPVIVWWAPLGGISNFGSVRQCGQQSCFITDLVKFHHHPNFKGYLFYGSTINWMHLPLPRNGVSMFWALLHEESPRNNIPLSYRSTISLFNYTSTFSRHSHVPLTTQYLANLESLTDNKYFESVGGKNGYQKNESWLLAPVVYIQTDCSTPIDRDSYVAELSKYIRVDSYGTCLHNRDLPPHLQHPFALSTMMSDDLLNIVGKYKFALAIENGVCEDYITEKLWRPLITGTVPIYIGSPTVADWLPNNHSAILGLDFDSPKHLAEYLHYLDTHDDDYNSYLSHKLKSTVSNSRLIQEVKKCYHSTIHSSQVETNLVSNFECYVCEKAHNQNPDEVSIATTDHYSCGMQMSILTRQPNVTNHWTNQWFYGRCEAEVVRNFIDSGVANYTVEEYDSAVKELVSKNKCWYSEENLRDLYLERLQK